MTSIATTHTVSSLTAHKGIPSQTAEQVVLNLGGTYRHHKFFTVAIFHDQEARIEFVAWCILHGHNKTEINEFQVAYTPNKIR